MPQGPPDKPDSVILSQFQGLKNTVTSERLAPSDLERATNVDLDDAGQLHRRRGITLKLEGNCHSLSQNLTLQLVVKDDELGVVYPDYSFSAVQSGAGDAPLAYVQVGPTIYFSSEDISGQLDTETLTASPWGAVVSAGEWLSPVVNPTSTLNPTRGKLLGKPPMATALGLYNGRIYLANGRELWCTELYLYNKVDKTRNYVTFEAAVTMIAAVSNGLYVGTEEGTYFLSGDAWPLRRYRVADSVIPGSLVTANPNLVDPQAAQSGASTSRAAVLFMTTSGLYAGLDGGLCYNLTQTRYLFPAASRGAGLFRQQDGVNSFVGVLDSAGTPTAQSRMGDYADAEIVRFKGVL